MTTASRVRPLAAAALLALGLAGAAPAILAQSMGGAPVRQAVPGVQSSGAPAGATSVAAPGAAAGAAPGAVQSGAFRASGEIMRPSATLGPAPGQGSGGGAVSGNVVVPGGAGNGGMSGGAAASAGGTVAPGGFLSSGSTPVPPRFPGIARFLSVGKSDAVLYDAPSERAKRIFLAPPGMPVEVVSVLRNWVKIRDAQGDLTWVVRDDLTDKRMVIANAVVPLRREPQPMAATWFNLDQGVVVELVDERLTNGFVQVRYAEGQIGWLPPAQVWGL